MDENSREDQDRERYRELLEELRTIIPGAQVLFAFLLTVPFASRFEQVDSLGKSVFTVSLAGVAAATIFFLAPTAYHRMVGHHDRRRRLRFGVKTALAGLFLLALSFTLALFVVVRFIFDSTILSAAIAGSIALLTAVMWYILPLLKSRSVDRRGDR